MAETFDAAALVAKQTAYFNSGATQDVNGRIIALRRLYDAIKSHENEIADALHEDLGKCADESYLTEVGLVLSEISFQIAHVRKWARPTPVYPGLLDFPSTAMTYHCPKGVVLVLSPWNYPFQLTMDPLVGAVAAGDTVICRPSDHSPATSAVMARLIAEVFDEQHVACVIGDHTVADALLAQPVNHVFFTGSKRVGSMVMAAAAKIPAPITLELGGQSPAIVCADANLELAARRIVFGKGLNSGQTCVCPDYVLVDEKVHDRFVTLLKAEWRRQYGTEPLKNPDWPHMVDKKAYERVLALIQANPEKVVLGGQSNPDTLQIAPTVMDNVAATDQVMSEEIFGPVLPVMTFQDLDEVFSFVRSKDRPLATYLFTEDKQLQRRVCETLAFGSGCINDAVMQLTSSTLGFGGVGGSGLGRYHGKYSFDTFTESKSIMRSSTRVDLPLRYQPYRPALMKLVRFLER